MAYVSEFLAPRANFSQRISAVRDVWMRRRAQRAEENRVYAELSSMTDRDLADLNLSRVQIGDVAREAGRMV
ncbi:DUF1127 domain-containing protein [Celeribacter arenosi]|uniref:YjiS-like domain-containing protein n=1 Tax=Celeribacter arenosi TaxID=792649 RepID=A0ABP7KGL5_9RHOB